MESVNNKLVKLSLGILSCVFFGCGPETGVNVDSITEDTLLQQKPEIENADLARLSQLETTVAALIKGNADINKMAQEVNAELERLRNEKKAQEIAFDAESQEIYKKQAELTDEIARMVKEKEVLVSQNGELEEEFRALANASKTDAEFLRYLIRVVVYIEARLDVNNVGEYVPEVWSIGKGMNVRHLNSLACFRYGAGLYVHGLEVKAKKAFCQKNLDKLEHLEDNGLKSQADKLLKRINAIKEYLDDEEFKNELEGKIRTACYDTFDKKCEETTGINCGVEALLAKAQEVNQDRAQILAFETFLVTYCLLDKKTNHSDNATVWSAFWGQAAVDLGKAFGDEVRSMVINAFEKSLEASVRRLENIDGQGSNIWVSLFGTNGDAALTVLKEGEGNTKAVGRKLDCLSIGSLFRLSSETPMEIWGKIGQNFGYPNEDEGKAKEMKICTDIKVNGEWADGEYLFTVMNLARVLGIKVCGKDYEKVKTRYTKWEKGRAKGINSLEFWGGVKAL